MKLPSLFMTPVPVQKCFLLLLNQSEKPLKNIFICVKCVIVSLSCTHNDYSIMWKVFSCLISFNNFCLIRFRYYSHFCVCTCSVYKYQAREKQWNLCCVCSPKYYYNFCRILSSFSQTVCSGECQIRTSNRKNRKIDLMVCRLKIEISKIILSAHTTRREKRKK